MRQVLTGGALENFTPKEILAEFDAFLNTQGLKFDGVLVGGAAITLAGYRDRMTADMSVGSSVNSRGGSARQRLLF